MSDYRLTAAARALREDVLRRKAEAARRGAVDDEGDPIVDRWEPARDPAALSALRARFELPAVYDEFLARHSSHDYVDAGLRCGDAEVWLAPVDTVAALTDACAGDPRLGAGSLVCATGPQGYYALDLAGGAVRFVPESGLPPREVAADFLTLLRRIARDTRRPTSHLPPRTDSAAVRRAHAVRMALIAATVVAVVGALVR